MGSNRVTETKLPRQSRLNERVGPRDFLDCYVVDAEMPPRKAAELISDFPRWVKFLMTLRRLLTTPFGLSNDGPPSKDKVGIFPVEFETPDELIAGFNDRHLDFRVSVMSREGRIYLATWVHPHNFGGRLYLTTIMPFHIMISRNALRRVAQDPQKEVFA
ncbi:MAG: DUF2867 domain-containing protein [Paracoccaceae bacterium]